MVCVVAALINSVGHCDELPLRCVLLFSLVFLVCCVVLFCGALCMRLWLVLGGFWFVIIAWGLVCSFDFMSSFTCLLDWLSLRFLWFIYVILLFCGFVD